MNDKNNTSINDNISETVVQMPVFSYLTIFNCRKDLLFSYSFDFSTDYMCQTFFLTFSESNRVARHRLSFIIEITQKLIDIIMNKVVKINGALGNIEKE